MAYILVALAALKIFKYLVASATFWILIRIRGVYPGSEFFHPGSRIPEPGSKKDSGSLIRKNSGI
jgi:hypothetical protein